MLATRSKSPYRYLDGTFYTKDWVPLFTPLTTGQEQEFVQRISSLELSGTTITKAVLKTVAAQVSDVY